MLYLGSIGGLLVYSFWSLAEFTGLIDRTFTLSTYESLLDPANRDIVLRTLGMASAVTIACSILAFPARVLHGSIREPREAGSCCISRC